MHSQREAYQREITLEERELRDDRTPRLRSWR
jgi:hypothetical protein